jgi:hypothetical protein
MVLYRRLIRSTPKISKLIINNGKPLQKNQLSHSCKREILLSDRQLFPKKIDQQKCEIPPKNNTHFLCSQQLYDTKHNFATIIVSYGFRCPSDRGTFSFDWSRGTKTFLSPYMTIWVVCHCRLFSA